MAWYDCIQPVSARDLNVLEARLNKRMNAQQTQIDALAVKLQAAEAVAEKTAAAMETIKTSVDAMKTKMANMQQQITDLQTANPALDLTALQSAADAVAGEVSTVETAAEGVVADLPPAA